MKPVLVTGGAGFIGSHLIDKLLELGHHVICIDNFSSGKKEYVEHHKSNDFILIEGDILDIPLLEKTMKGCGTVFHLAANPDVRLGETDTKIHLQQNIIATYNVLEAMRKLAIKTIIFTSTSTVYGDAVTIPTSEDYGPLIPISLYGASKMACEALIAAYCNTFNLNSVIYRFANVVGPRSTHGVTYDFVKKLKENPSELEILGDGNQMKSYLYISDCVDAMLFGMAKMQNPVEVFNIGSEDSIDVKTIAKIVSQVMGINPTYTYTGGVDGGRGWKGDVKTMRLSIEALKSRGWIPQHTSEESIRLTTQALL